MNPLYLIEERKNAFAVKPKVPLRVCQDCDYTTFSHYINCPRCRSEKWRNEV